MYVRFCSYAIERDFRHRGRRFGPPERRVKGTCLNFSDSHVRRECSRSGERYLDDAGGPGVGAVFTPRGGAGYAEALRRA